MLRFAFKYNVFSPFNGHWLFVDLKKSYYSMLGQLEMYSKSLIKDKDELEKLEAIQNFSGYFLLNSIFN